MVSLLCVFACVFKEELVENAVPHTLKENGFSPLCVRMCFLKEELVENADPQTSQ